MAKLTTEQKRSITLFMGFWQREHWLRRQGRLPFAGEDRLDRKRVRQYIAPTNGTQPVGWKALRALFIRLWQEGVQVRSLGILEIQGLLPAWVAQDDAGLDQVLRYLKGETTDSRGNDRPDFEGRTRGERDDITARQRELLRQHRV